MPDAMPSVPTSLDTLLRRASVPPRLLQHPAPDAHALDLAVAAALRAPDHGGRPDRPDPGPFSRTWTPRADAPPPAAESCPFLQAASRTAPNPPAG